MNVLVHQLDVTVVTYYVLNKHFTVFSCRLGFCEKVTVVLHLYWAAAIMDLWLTIHHFVLEVLNFIGLQDLFKHFETTEGTVNARFTPLDLQKDREIVLAFDQDTDDVNLVLNIALLHHFFNFLGLYAANDLFSV